MTRDRKPTAASKAETDRMSVSHGDHLSFGSAKSEALEINVVPLEEEKTVVVRRLNAGPLDSLLGRLERDIALEQNSMDQLLSRLRKIAR